MRAPAPAPFFAEIAAADLEARAFWLRTADRVRIRVARLGRGSRGTAVLFPGRAEFAERYGPVGRRLAEAGYGSLCIDWRGQGLSDRLHPDPAAGHSHGFLDYQRDVEAALGALPALGLVTPLAVVGHSMGGTIGLRSLLRGAGFRAAAFCGPMWGLRLTPLARPVARTVRALGHGGRYPPGYSAQAHLLRIPFAGNPLTSDAETFAWMRHQISARPELALGGPTFGWVDAALTEIATLRRQPPPPVPCLVALGTEERIVDPGAVRARMAGWPAGRLLEIPGARHEILMETPARRDAFWHALVAHLAGAL